MWPDDPSVHGGLASRASTAPPPSILLVDDRAENLRALEAVLDSLSARVVHASSAEEALRRVEEEEFAVILLDVQMPDTDGLEAARQIKARERGRVAPILFITALDQDRRHITSAYQTGAVDYLFKPVDPDQLRGKVAAFLDLHRVQADDRDRHRRYADRLVSLSEERYRKAAAEAEQARASLEVSDRIKREFLARMSHEFRTPLNAILGYVQLLDLGVLGALAAEQHTYLNRVRHSAVHLLGLVNEILDLVTLETADIRVVREIGHVGDVCDAALALVRIDASLRELTVVGLPAGEPGAAYVGDPDRVRQVLVHLVTNAVKFTPPGGRVVVTCGTTTGARTDPDAPGHGGPWAYVRVTDTGIGIAPEQRAHIFEAFTQVSGGHTRTEGGAGLGLTISLRLARAMGGDVTVRSEPGRGSVFTLWLPTPDAAGGSEAAEPSAFGDPGSPWPAGADGKHGSDPGPVDEAIDAEATAGSPTTHQEMAALGMALSNEIEAIMRQHLVRLRSERSLPNVGVLSDAQLRDHTGTLVGEVAQVLTVMGQTEGRSPELFRDSGQILRLVSELHGAQRRRLGWRVHDCAHEIDLLYAEIVVGLRRAAAEHHTGDNVLEQATRLVERLLEQSRRTSLQSFSAAHPASGG